MGKETFEKAKNILKMAGKGLVVLGVGLTMLTACNQIGQETNPSTDSDENKKPPIEQVQISVSKILADMSEFKQLNLLGEFDDVALDIVDKNVEGEADVLVYTVENHNFVVAQNKDGSFTSIAVPLSET